MKQELPTVSAEILAEFNDAQQRLRSLDKTGKRLVDEIIENINAKMRVAEKDLAALWDRVFSEYGLDPEPDWVLNAKTGKISIDDSSSDPIEEMLRSMQPRQAPN